MATIRLRSAPPHWRRRGNLTPILLAVLAAVAVLSLVSLRTRGRDLPAVSIVPVPPTPATGPMAARELDGTLISLPPLAPPRPFLAEHRIISYYGNPLAEILGVLGSGTPQEVVAKLKAQADAYRAVSTDRTVVPAIHLIYAVAQSYPGPDGSHLLRMDDAMIREWVRIAKDNGLLLFLDIQMGKSTVEAELPHLYPYLTEEHVHVALDPEFAWGPEGKANVDIGHMTGPQINAAQALLQRFAIEQKLPTKMLVIHQFLPGMVKQKQSVKLFDRVELVYDADGFGPRNVKLGSWNRVIVDDKVEQAAIKLFYKHDVDLLTPADVLAYEPKPLIVIYQ